MLLLAVPAYSQNKVVIEGGPGEVQISDRDGKAEPVDPRNNKIGEPVAVLPPVPEAAVVQPVPTSDVKVLVPIEKPDVRGKTVTKMKPKPTAPREPEQISPEASKRMAEIKRELEMAESAGAARVVFTADEIFSKKSPVINDTAELSLKMLVEFMGLSPKDAATISYKFVAAEESETSARLRALALADYLSKIAGTTRDDFTVLDPEPVTADNAVTSTSGQIISTEASLIESTLK